MNTIEFLGFLRSLDVHLTADGQKLGCNAPKGVLTDELKSEVKARKPEILDFLNQAKADAFSRPIPRLPAQEQFAPTAGQRRLWFLDQLDGKAGYNIAGGLRLRGPLNRGALEESLREIVRRHEALRTSIVKVDGAPRAIVRNAPEWAPEFLRFTELPPASRESELEETARAFAARHFDLASAPLLRACLVELGPEDHALLLVMHHIAADGWSLNVLADELEQLYAAFAAGRPSPLAPPAIQYSDYAAWQRRNLESGMIQTDLAYWKQQLGGPLPVMTLPADRHRQPQTPVRGARLRLPLPDGLVARVRALSASEGVTPFVTLLAAFQILLSRYTRQTDIIVGSATAGRSRPELENLIGLFINNLVLRTDLAGDPSVRDILGRAKETALNAFAHENAPLDLLAQMLRPDRGLHLPLFQLMFVMQKTPGLAHEFGGLSIEPFEIDNGGARFDLTLDALEDGEQIDLRWEYDASLFDESAVARFHEHYQQLLESMIADPQSSLSRLRMLTPGEEARLIVEGSGGEIAFPDLCIHEWFERQAGHAPDAVAVICGAEQVTYGELEERANRMAGRLRKMGIGDGARVAVCLEPCPAMVVALLGVLKAGAAYVPLDAGYPRSRLAFMLEDSHAEVLITAPHLLAPLPVEGQRTLFIGVDDHADPSIPSNPPATAQPDRLAYVIYTSGSTGKPKGVEITHRSVVNLLASMQREPGILPGDRLLAVTALSFDIAALEIFLPLVTGACVILAPANTRADGRELGRLLTESQATIMQGTPATWRMLINSGWEGSSRLKILCGGEALSGELSERLLAAGDEVWNLYGPTETTIWSTIHRVRERAGMVPIGRPIANTYAYVVDESSRLVPPGVPGELCLSGAGVARGYLGRPDLTAEKFSPNPFRPGAMLYRTGDLVCWRPRVGLEYLGRMDQQVKLRGFRIELGEIEAVLRQQKSIRDAAVAICEPAPGDLRLVAYVVTQEGVRVQGRELREILSHHLPEYMLPSRFEFLDALPLTPNGKIDRNALPAPARQMEAPARYVPPRTGKEREVAAIWADLLKKETIGANDNFFDLGGHSLLAVQLQFRLARRFNLEIPIVELFQRPTVSSIAALLNSAAGPAAQV